MASIMDKVMRFARSSQGQRVLRQATAKAKQLARDPKTRARIDEARRRATGGGRTPPPAP